MLSVARIKLGFYPLPVVEGERVKQLLLFPPNECALLDPRAGEGDGLGQLTEGVTVVGHAVEVDTQRAKRCERAGLLTIHGTSFDVQAKSSSFSLLYLNPPYDSEVESFGHRRMKLLFLQKTYRWLTLGECWRWSRDGATIVAFD